VSWYPRARNLNFRTLEVFRGLGLGAEVVAASGPISRVFRRERLASTDQKELVDPASLLDTTALSPEPFARYCPQSRLEPLLLAAARKGGADVRYHTELGAFTQDAHGVTATLTDRATGDSSVLEADFLVGADGAHSGVRQRLDIPTQGQGTLDEHYVFIYFRAPWEPLIRGHESDAFFIDNADVQGIFLVAEPQLGMFVLTFHPSQGETAAALTRERCQWLVERAMGQPDIGVEIVEIAPWQPAQAVAERFQQGRVLLVGDAAHTMPPKEGEGVNTGIQSAQNLGWKLAAVLQGQAGAALLATYHTERHPVGWVCLPILPDRPGGHAAGQAPGGAEAVGVLPHRRLSLSLQGDPLRGRRRCPGPGRAGPAGSRGADRAAGDARPAPVARAAGATPVHPGPARWAVRAAGGPWWRAMARGRASGRRALGGALAGLPGWTGRGAARP
jgi:2-polyprenyl-6-methoxyphenol hydroxylase-like FAD-dependent oxidoreductase